MSTKLIYPALFLLLTISCGSDHEIQDASQGGAEHEACADVDVDVDVEHITPPKEFISDPQASVYDFCLVTHTTVSPYIYPALTAANHAAYAKLHGYKQQAYFERISGGLFFDPDRGPMNDVYGGGLYWQKFTAVQNMLDAVSPSTGERECRWVMWIDADAIIMRPDLALDTILDMAMANTTHAEKNNIHVVLSHDINNRPVNAGVFFVRNSEQGRSFIASATAMYPLYKDGSFPEQDAMTTLAFVDHIQVDGQIAAQPHRNIATVPQRIFNAFGFDSDLDAKYTKDARWQSGDFVAHFAGMIHTQRDLVIPKYLSQIEW